MATGMSGSPLPDPGLIVSGISAVLQAAQTWIAYKDSKRAAEEFRLEIGRGAQSPALANAASQLSLAPPNVVAALGTRVEECWNKYYEMLTAPSGTYMPTDLDDATEAVKRCVCRELKRLKAVNGHLPPGKFTEWWRQYGCQ